MRMGAFELAHGTPIPCPHLTAQLRITDRWSLAVCRKPYNDAVVVSMRLPVGGSRSLHIIDRNVFCVLA
jgi:hypothetical protein